MPTVSIKPQCTAKTNKQRHRGLHTALQKQHTSIMLDCGIAGIIYDSSYLKLLFFSSPKFGQLHRLLNAA